MVNKIKNLKLKYKIAISVGLMLVIFLSALLLIVSTRMHQTYTEQAEILVTEISARNAEKVSAEFNSVQDVVVKLGSFVEYGVQSNSLNVLNREAIIGLLTDSLKESDKIFALYTAWEPDAYSYDVLYRNKPGFDDTGRFKTCLYRSGDQVRTKILDEINEEGVGDFYLIPKETKEPILTEPHDFDIDGKIVKVVSFSVPILDKDGDFLGVVGGHIDITYLQSRCEEITPFDGYTYIKTGRGTFIADGSNASHMGGYIEHCPTDFSDLRAGRNPDRGYRFLK